MTFSRDLTGVFESHPTIRAMPSIELRAAALLNGAVSTSPVQSRGVWKFMMEENDIPDIDPFSSSHFNGLDPFLRDKLT